MNRSVKKYISAIIASLFFLVNSLSVYGEPTQLLAFIKEMIGDDYE